MKKKTKKPVKKMDADDKKSFPKAFNKTASADIRKIIKKDGSGKTS
jgi:hypothetical protein